MKKLFLLACMALFSVFYVNAQGETKVAGSVGFVTGNFGDGYTFSLTLEVSQLWKVADDFKAGGNVGISHFFGKNLNGVSLSDITFLPIAGSAHYNVSDDFIIGFDLGYALGINEGNDGGFYYAPRLEFGVSENMGIIAAYRNVSNDGTSLGHLTLGVSYGF